MLYLTLFYVHWREGVRFPAAGSSDSCELPYGCWELNPGPLEEQHVLLTTEPSLQCIMTTAVAPFFPLVLVTVILLFTLCYQTIVFVCVRQGLAM